MFEAAVVSPDIQAEQVQKDSEYWLMVLATYTTLYLTDLRKELQHQRSSDLAGSLAIALLGEAQNQYSTQVELVEAMIESSALLRSYRFAGVSRGKKASDQQYNRDSFKRAVVNFAEKQNRINRQSLSTSSVSSSTSLVAAIA